MRDLLLKYENYLNSIGKRKNTISAYVTDVSMYLKFIEANKYEINEEGYSLTAYVQYLTQCKKSTSSIQRTIIALRNFYSFLVAENVIAKVPPFNAQRDKVERKKPIILSVDEITKIMNSTTSTTDKGLRDKALLELMYATGMKVSELISLDLEDVDLELCYVKCKDNKGYERLIPIGREAKESLKRYIEVRKYISRDNDKLFINMNGDPITRQGVWMIVKECSASAGIKKEVNLNTFRHSFAVHLLQNGANAKVVQELLGNQVMTYIDIYYDIINKEKINSIYKKTHPRA